METSVRTISREHRTSSLKEPARTSPIVVFPGAVCSRSPIGGKAAALNALSETGIPIPEWFVVIPASAALAGGDGTGVAVSPALRREIQKAVDRLEPTFLGLAVRSSALEEDGDVSSFAGQFESFLNVAPEEVPEAVVRVWRSAFSRGLDAYRKLQGMDYELRLPSVIVQRMVAATSSGVAFGADPVTGRRTVRVVSAVRGTGEELVSGHVEADTWTINREGIVRTAHVSMPDHPVLTTRQVTQIASLVKAAGRHFGKPQDIEWAFDGETPYLLQSRPITTLDSLSDPDGTRSLWDNTNIVESYGGVTTPLTFSFVRAAYEEVYKTFARNLGVPETTIAKQRPLFGTMIGLIDGRIYYNLRNWHKLLSSLPGVRFTWDFHKQMIGVREDHESPTTAEAELENAFSGSWGILKLIVALCRWHVALEDRKHTFNDRLEMALGLASRSLTDLRLDELAGRFRHLQANVLSRWDAPVMNDFFAMVFYGLLKKLTTRWCKSQSLHHELLAGGGNIVSSEPVKRIEQMARLVENDPEMLDLLATGSPRQVETALRSRLLLAAHVREYLCRFGDRCLNELKLESPTLDDTPDLLYRSIAACAQGRQRTDATPRITTSDDTRVVAEQLVAGLLARHPVRRGILRWALRHARARVRDRENLRFARTKAFGLCRRIFLEMGRRLAAENVLEDARDVFYLEVEELLGFVDGTATTCNLRGLAALRKTEYQIYSQKPAPPQRFETTGCVNIGRQFHASSRGNAIRGDLSGLGCSPGRVQGLVRHVTDPNACRLTGEEILVAESTDPGWVVLFPSCKGVLVERGSVLSHVAIVAREIGIPTIVAIEGLTESLHDGERIEMDGATGTITRLGPVRPLGSQTMEP